METLSENKVSGNVIYKDNIGKENFLIQSKNYDAFSGQPLHWLTSRQRNFTQCAGAMKGSINNPRRASIVGGETHPITLVFYLHVSRMHRQPANSRCTLLHPYMCIRHARNALTEAEIRAAVICDDESGIAAFMWVDLVMLVLRERNYGLLHGRRRFAIYVRRRVQTRSLCTKESCGLEFQKRPQQRRS